MSDWIKDFAAGVTVMLLAAVLLVAVFAVGTAAGLGAALLADRWFEDPVPGFAFVATTVMVVVCLIGGIGFAISENT